MTISELPDKDANPLSPTQLLYCVDHRNDKQKTEALRIICRNLYRTHRKKEEEVMSTLYEKKACYFCEMLKFPKDEDIVTRTWNTPLVDIIAGIITWCIIIFLIWMFS